jgi:hypothetical protein
MLAKRLDATMDTCSKLERTLYDSYLALRRKTVERTKNQQSLHIRTRWLLWGLRERYLDMAVGLVLRRQRSPVPIDIRRQLCELVDSFWFDPEYYMSNYPDVAEARLDPAYHYHFLGVSEGRNPHPLFDTNFYMKSNPDVVASGLNPLYHFVRWGVLEGRAPHPLVA